MKTNLVNLLLYFFCGPIFAGVCGNYSETLTSESPLFHELVKFTEYDIAEAFDYLRAKNVKGVKDLLHGSAKLAQVYESRGFTPMKHLKQIAENIPKTEPIVQQLISDLKASGRKIGWSQTGRAYYDIRANKIYLDPVIATVFGRRSYVYTIATLRHERTHKPFFKYTPGMSREEFFRDNLPLLAADEMNATLAGYQTQSDLMDLGLPLAKIGTEQFLQFKKIVEEEDLSLSGKVFGAYLVISANYYPDWQKVLNDLYRSYTADERIEAIVAAP